MGRDSNPRYRSRYTHFPGARLRPLGHPSVLRACACICAVPVWLLRASSRADEIDMHSSPSGWKPQLIFPWSTDVSQPSRAGLRDFRRPRDTFDPSSLAVAVPGPVVRQRGGHMDPVDPASRKQRTWGCIARRRPAPLVPEVLRAGRRRYRAKRPRQVAGAAVQAILRPPASISSARRC